MEPLVDEVALEAAGIVTAEGEARGPATTIVRETEISARQTSLGTILALSLLLSSFTFFF